MVSADVALKASMYFWMLMMVGYVAALPIFVLLSSTERAAHTTIIQSISHAILTRRARDVAAYHFPPTSPTSAA